MACLRANFTYFHLYQVITSSNTWVFISEIFCISLLVTHIKIIQSVDCDWAELSDRLSTVHSGSTWCRLHQGCKFGNLTVLYSEHDGTNIGTRGSVPGKHSDLKRVIRTYVFCMITISFSLTSQEHNLTFCVIYLVILCYIIPDVAMWTLALSSSMK